MKTRDFDMKEFKGTKGTWVVEKYPAPLNQMRRANFGIIADNGVRTPICYLPCSTADKQSDILIEKQTSNAQLIAASPDMLRTLLTVQKSMLKKGITLENADLWNEIDKCIKQALGK